LILRYLLMRSVIPRDDFYKLRMLSLSLGSTLLVLALLGFSLWIVYPVSDFLIWMLGLGQYSLLLSTALDWLTLAFTSREKWIEIQTRFDTRLT